MNEPGDNIDRNAKLFWSGVALWLLIIAVLIIGCAGGSMIAIARWLLNF